MKEFNIEELSLEEMEVVERQIQNRKSKEKEENQAAYLKLRNDFMITLKHCVLSESKAIETFAAFVREESAGFMEVMKEYGQLRRTGQMSYVLIHNDFRFEVKANKVKKFDERADVAAERLIDFLRQWIEDKDKGADDPLYQLAMTLIERNANGDLDYKQISKLYQLEDKFKNSEYSEIMSLFKESHTVESIAVHYYFYQKDEYDVWRKIEISFNRI